MRFKSFNSPQLVEAKLTPAVLAEPNSATKEDRIDILIKLVGDKQPLELAKGGTFTVGNDYIDDVLAHCANFKKNKDHYGKGGFTLTDKSGKEIKSNDLKKSKVFGGGVGGAGSGTKDTARNECHNACMIKAMIDDGSNYEIEHFDSARIAKAYKDNGATNLSVNTDTILETPEEWWISSYNNAKWIVENGYANKSHVISREGAGMNMVYALKNQAYKNNGFKPLKDDKWNPGDVWAIEKGLNLKDELDTSSVGAFNASIMNLYVERRLVGISLKGPIKKYPPYNKEFNLRQPPTSPIHKLKEVKLESNRGDFWSSKGMDIVFDSGILNFKDGSPGKSNKAEIKGKKARGGGLGWGIMQEFVRRETGIKMPDHTKGIVKMAKAIEKKNKQALKDIFTKYQLIYPSADQKEFEKELAKKDWRWISAKYAALTLGSILVKHTGKKSNAMVTNFVNYAGSDLLDSSTYVKVGK
jgi:hypothetical protein